MSVDLDPVPAARRPRLLWSFVLACGLAVAVLALLIQASGVWSFLANTRLLQAAVAGGIVALRDDQPGFILGVPDLEHWWKAQDPVDWAPLWVAAALFLAYYCIKALQYHWFCRVTGVPGAFGAHARAYFWGQGVGRFLPFNAGSVALASALAGPGGRPAARAVFLGEVSTLFEIAVFALVGLLQLGWGLWFAQIFWPLVILAVTIWIARAARGDGRPAILHGAWRDVAAAVRDLAGRPGTLARLALLGLVAFGFQDLVAYAVAMGFTGDRVIIDVPFGVLLMGVVGSYIARLVPITPGGIGQYELGFALALYWGGLGLPECVALAVLVNVLRYAVAAALMLASQFGWGAAPPWERVLDQFNPPAEPARDSAM
jgi:uncharacterized membrane protein YbhN (UPF0104 family)